MNGNLPNIPGYRIERVLGAGGMAAVFLAIQESLNRPVAIKILANTLSLDERFRQRFLREAQMVALLRNPNIMRVYEVGTANDTLYMVTEYYDGGTLKDRIAGEHLKPVDAVAITLNLAKALGVAHDKGIFHRDIKPDNVLFDSDGRFVLADFGIAKSSDGGGGLTNTGAVIGTPCYMSPEQFKGDSVDGRSDIYALGVLFYEMLTGKPPFVDNDPYALGVKHIKQPPPPVTGNLSQYQLLLDKMLAKDPAQRFQDCKELEQAIDKLQGEVRTEKVSNTDRLREVAARHAKKESRARKAIWRLPLIAAGVALVVGMAIYVGWRFTQNRPTPSIAAPPASIDASAPAQQTPIGSSKPSTQSLPNTNGEATASALQPANPNAGAAATSATGSGQSQTGSLAATPSATSAQADQTAPQASIAPKVTAAAPPASKPAVASSEKAVVATLSEAQRQQLSEMDFQALEKYFAGLLAGGKIAELRAGLGVSNSHSNVDRIMERFKTLLTMLAQNGMPRDRAVLSTQDLVVPLQRTLAQLDAKAKQLGAGADTAAERVRVDRTILALDPGNAAAKGRINAASADFVDAIKAAEGKSNADAAAKIRSRALKLDPENVQFQSQ